MFFFFFFLGLMIFLNLLLIYKFFILQPLYNSSDRNGIGENNYWSFSKGRSGSRLIKVVIHVT